MCTMRSFVIFSLAFLTLSSFGHDLDPEMELTTPQIIEHWGYPAEVHEAVTEDGYILEMHRIPYGRISDITWPDGKRPVVFMQHGLEGDSSNWVVNLPTQSAGFLFADAGYDVWLGNFRGNTYGLKHQTLNNTGKEFWDWTWDEMAEYDLPAMMNKILEVTEQPDLYYIGHSQGTLTMFSRLSNDTNGLGKKIRKFFALAPVGSVKHIKGILKAIYYLLSAEFDLWLDLFGPGRFFSSGLVTRFLADSVCTDTRFGIEVCDRVLFLSGGPESNQWNDTRVPIYIAHSPAGTSTKNIAHWSQMVRHGAVPHFNFGTKKNLAKYGQPNAPYYDFKNINVPLHLYWSDTDWLATRTDIQTYLMNNLEPSIIQESVELTDFNHFDFIWGLRAAADIYYPIIDTILQDVNSKF